MEMNEKTNEKFNMEMKVDAIKNGSVLDHLPPGKALEIIRLLKINSAAPILMGTNLISKKYGKKDILKIENYELSQEELNTISLLAPQADLTIIRDFKVAKKAQVSLPDTLAAVFNCPNLNCVTNHEKIPTKFKTGNKKGIKLKCLYCERRYTSEEVLKSI